MYKVITSFVDRFDEGYAYQEGDVYPREGFSPPEGRTEALCNAQKSKLNRLGQVFLVDAPAEP